MSQLAFDFEPAALACPVCGGSLRLHLDNRIDHTLTYWCVPCQNMTKVRAA